MDKRSNIEDLYPLTPLQEGMLAASLKAGRGVYVEQTSYRLPRLGLAAFSAAWRETMARHPALRTGFVYDSVERPVQVVYRNLECPVREFDLATLTAPETESRLAALRRAELEAGFELNRPPLMRIALVHLDADSTLLLWTFHHILLDGWSALRVVAEAAAIGDAQEHGQPHRLPVAPRFRDYVRWLQGRDQVAAEAFWREHLEGVSGPTPLGLPRRRHAVPLAADHATLCHRLPPDLARDLAECARGWHLTQGTLYLGAWARLLALYSGEDAPVFGVATSGRPPDLPGAEAMVGLLVNTLPLRVPVNAAAGVRDWLAGLQRRQAAVRGHEHCSLVDIQRWCGTGAGQPLFHTILNIESVPAMGPAQMPEVEVDEHLDLPLSVVVVPGAKPMVRAQFNPMDFDEETIERLLRHYETVLRQLVASPDRRLGECDALDDAERALLLAMDTPPLPPGADATLEQAIARQVTERPQAAAVVYGELRLSYADLDRRAWGLARALASRGCRAGERVPILFEPSVDVVVAMLALLRLGCVYAPLEPQTPAPRLSAMVRALGARHLLAAPGLGPALDVPGCEILSMNALDLDDSRPLSVRPDPQDLLYAIHTSGSTGTPKAAGVYRHSYFNLVRAWISAFGLGPGDRTLLTNRLSHDLAQKSLWAPLASGGTVYILEGRFDPRRILDQVAGHGIHWLSMTPSMAYALMEAAGDFRALAGLRWLFVGGEPLDTEPLRAWAASPHFRGRFVTTYGPTETSDVSHWHCFSREEILDPAFVVPVGCGIPGLRTLVVDRNGRRLPLGVSGEIVIGGLAVGPGYLSDPAMTAERFLPEDGQPGERMYLTGDLGRQDPEGRLYVSGRRDFQIKIRGFRVEPGEIDSLLRAQPGVRDALTLLHPGQQPELVSYLIAPGADPAAMRAGLVARCRERLPGHMVPSAFVLLDSWPLGATGKLDRAALPTPGRDDRPGIGTTVEPRDDLERELLGLWRALLPQAGQFGVEDSFFALGGDSLLLTRLYARIPKTLGVTIPLSQLFLHPTVAELANAVRALRRSDAADAPPTPTPRPQRPPLSHTQERLWFLYRYAPENPAYNVPVFVPLSAPVRADAVRAALLEVCNRHEILRTRFPAPDGQPYQEVLAEADPEWEWIEFDGLPDDQAKLAAATTRQLAMAFDIAAHPPLRALLALLPDGSGLLMLTLHHLIIDGWSAEILRNELVIGSAAHHAGTPAMLPQVALQYIDYAIWQRGILAGGRLDALLGYWRGQLAGATPDLRLPYDFPRPARLDYAGELVRRRLPAGLVAAAGAWADALGVSRFTLLCAAFAALLHRLSGQTDVVIGTPVAQRHVAGTEDLMGCLVNTLALRLRPDPRAGMVELIRQTQEVLLAAQDHQDLPLELLVEHLAPARRTDAQPLFQVLFTLESKAAPSAPVEEEQWVARFDLQVVLSPDGDGLTGVWEYRRELFRADTVEHIAALYERLIESALTQPGRALGVLPLGGQRPQAAPRELDTRDSIEALFAAQARARPAATAVICAGRHLRYSELDARANRLAHWLLAHGLRPNRGVGVSLPRGFDLCIALLGILKAGGSYVPLDPAYPEARLRFMATDAGLELLLTDGRGLGQWAGMGLNPVDLTAPGIAAELDAAPADAPPPVDLGNAQRIAYLVYTSGTTGNPKGVVALHRGVIRLVCGHNHYPLDAETVMLQAAPVAFDASTWELWGPLLNGGAVAVYDEPHMDPERLDRLLVEAGVNTAFLTTALFHQWAARLRGPTPLRWLLAGGEIVSPEAVTKIQTVSPGTQIYNVYGPTENTTYSTLSPIPRGFDPRMPLPVGRTIDYSSALVLDPELQPLAVGLVGELYLGGAGVAMGYLAQPGLTAERFLPDPFGPPGSRLYASGDRARLRPDGQIDFLGRMDEQLKIRGFRIEPAEIEQVLLRHPEVAACAVVPHQDPDLGLGLAAYLEPANPGAAPCPETIERFARAFLPGYMIPRHWTVIEHLPVNANGKVERSRLPAPAAALPGGTRVPPANELEAHMLGIWQQLLGRTDFGVTDDFFDLGGHSLLAARLAAATRAELGLDLALSSVFDSPTVRGLAHQCGLMGWHTRAGAETLNPETEELGTL